MFSILSVFALAKQNVLIFKPKSQNNAAFDGFVEWVGCGSSLISNVFCHLISEKLTALMHF